VSSSNTPFVVVITDGWTKSVFMDLYADGALPEINDLLVRKGVLFENVISIVPSVSIASHTTILTGSNQAVHGIPGHRWLDADRRPHNYIGAGIRRVNGDIRQEVKTLYESAPMPVHAVQSIIRRGAASTRTLPTLNPKALLRCAARTIRRNPGDSCIVWLPRGDAFAHRFGPNSVQVQRDMVDTSRELGRFLQTPGLEDYNILMVPDHGHREVTANVDLLSTLRRLGVSQPVQNPKRHGAIGPEATVVMSSGDASAYLYPPRAESIEATLRLCACLSREPGIELAVIQESETEYLFHSAAGAARATLHRGCQDLSYRIEHGSDPLGVCGDSPGTWLPDFRNRPPDLNQNYPDALRLIIDSWVRERSGTILLLAAQGCQFGLSPRVAWRLGKHRGSHGGPFPVEVIVSAIFRPSASRGLSNMGKVSTEPIHASSLASLLTARDPLPGAGRVGDELSKLLATQGSKRT
jgi:hypothetical protein